MFLVLHIQASVPIHLTSGITDITATLLLTVLIAYSGRQNLGSLSKYMHCQRTTKIYFLLLSEPLILFQCYSENRSYFCPDPPDCIARRQRTITSPWGNFQLTVWNPPEGEASEPLLTLMADFYGTDLPDDYTRVLVFREKIEVDVTSSESRSLTFVNISRILPEGWLEFRVELSQRLQIFAPGFNHPLLDIKNQMTVEQLFIEGSNITVNCKDRKIAK